MSPGEANPSAARSPAAARVIIELPFLFLAIPDSHRVFGGLKIRAVMDVRAP